MPRSVAIVFEPDYSAALEKLAFTTPVWLVDTPSNHSAAEAAWHSAVEWPHITVTLFRAPVAAPSAEDWKALLDQIAVRERAAEMIEVIGAPLTELAREVFARGGFGWFEESPSGFRARR